MNLFAYLHMIFVIIHAACEHFHCVNILCKKIKHPVLFDQLAKRQKKFTQMHIFSALEKYVQMYKSIRS